MTRDELIALVTNTLAIAQQRGDVPIIEICTELGSRLVAEVTEVVPTEPEALPPPAPAEPAPAEPPPDPGPLEVADCPVCAARRARRNAVQQRHRKKKRGGVSAKDIAQALD